MFIRPERYTHEFIEREGRFTLSFFKDEWKDALKFCGSKSGRDYDKCKETGLKGVALETGAVTFEQARLALDCRKLFKSPMTAANFIDKSVLERWYNTNPGGSLHDVPMESLPVRKENAKPLVIGGNEDGREAHVSHLKLEMVEVRGVEPLSETASPKRLRV